LFGSCDFIYPKYREALDLMKNQFQKQGAEVEDAVLKVELDPEAEDARGPETGGYINAECREES
jgi:hypothetical protein